MGGSVFQLVIGCPHLTHLDLCGCYVTDLTLTPLAVGLRKLIDLGLVGCESLTDNGIKYLLHGCPDLSEVDTEGCYGLTDAGVRHMEEVIVQRLVEEEEELWRTHVEWRRKVHDVMGKLKGVTEEVIRTAPTNSQIRKLARVELKTLQRLMECEEHEEARERMQREEAAQRVMRVAESTGEAEEEWTAALQSRAGTAAGGRLPPQGAAEATEERENYIYLHL